MYASIDGYIQVSATVIEHACETRSLGAHRYYRSYLRFSFTCLSSHGWNSGIIILDYHIRPDLESGDLNSIPLLCSPSALPTEASSQSSSLDSIYLFF